VGIAGRIRVDVRLRFGRCVRRVTRLGCLAPTLERVAGWSSREREHERLRMNVLTHFFKVYIVSFTQDLAFPWLRAKDE